MTKRLHSKYAGAEWLQENLDCMVKMKNVRRKKKAPISRIVLSDFGVLVADILGYASRGIYHMTPEALERADWTSDRYITVAWYHEVASWDYDELARLFVACHDCCVRLSVMPHGRNMLKIGFGLRDRKAGSMMEGHPTLEDNASRIRGEYEVVEEVDDWRVPA